MDSGEIASAISIRAEPREFRRDCPAISPTPSEQNLIDFGPDLLRPSVTASAISPWIPARSPSSGFREISFQMRVDRVASWHESKKMDVPSKARTVEKGSGALRCCVEGHDDNHLILESPSRNNALLTSTIEEMSPEERKSTTSRTIMIGGKAFATYTNAKRIVKLMNDVGAVVNTDPEVNNYLKCLVNIRVGATSSSFYRLWYCKNSLSKSKRKKNAPWKQAQTAAGTTVLKLAKPTSSNTKKGAIRNA
ncbi:hypothetical protein RJ639_018615 [Escallonia herrerae]|uniref:Alpha-1,4 glucan phosphorylase n=1 Tax=Escallonia herrerae TaxID=1293975 RepID=A0AA89AJG5_9ASTE|nr:hypothetical protein RJ639_018615 [Escallonia herrerae]